MKLTAKAWKDLQHVRDQFVQANLAYSAHGRLAFVHNPGAAGRYKRQEGATGINNGLHALSLRDPMNLAYLRQETTLHELIDQLDAVQSYGQNDLRDQRKGLVNKIKLEIDRLDRFKEDQWEEQRSGQIPTSIPSHHEGNAVIDTGTKSQFLSYKTF